jgi:hypothetical protein
MLIPRAFRGFTEEPIPKLGTEHNYEEKISFTKQPKSLNKMIFPYLKVVFLTIFRKCLNGQTYFSHANMNFSQNLEKSLHHSEDNYERIHTVFHDCVSSVKQRKSSHEAEILFVCKIAEFSYPVSRISFLSNATGRRGVPSSAD